MRDLIHKPEPKQLRPHQAKAIAMLRASLGSGNRRVVIQGPTGFGKTLVASEIVKSAQAKGNSVIFTAPAVSLIDQTVTAFRDHGVDDIGVIQANHPLTNPDASVQIATVQSLARRSFTMASLVIIDECHIYSAVTDRLMADNPRTVFVGLSATPWRVGMGLTWQDLVIPITIGELIEAGYLSKFAVYAPDVPDLSGVKISKGEYVESALEEIMGGAKIMGSVVQNWLERGERRPTLAFCVNRAHAAQVQAEFAAHGIASAYVDGMTDTVERSLISRRFRDGDVQVICSVRTMTTGVDLPVSCIIDSAPTRSEILHCQKIGRGLRVNEGTEDLVVFDHAGNTLRLGLVTDIRHETLDATPRGQKAAPKEPMERLPKACPKCGVLRAGRVCPACGHEVQPPRLDHAEGQLTQLSGKVKVPTMEDKRAFWGMCRWLQRDRGWSDGRTAHLYRDKFGVWPRGVDGELRRPDAAFMDYEKSRRIAFAKKMEKQREAQK